MSEKEIKKLKKQIKKLSGKNSLFRKTMKKYNDTEKLLKKINNKKALKRFYEIKNFNEKDYIKSFKKLKNQIKKDPFAESNRLNPRLIYTEEKNKKYYYILKLTERQVRNIGKEKKVFLEFEPKKSFMFLLNHNQIKQIEEAKKNKKRIELNITKKQYNDLDYWAFLNRYALNKMFRKNENNKFVLTGRKVFYETEVEENKYLDLLFNEGVIRNTIDKYFKKIGNLMI